MQGAIIENGIVINVILLPENFQGETWGGKQVVVSDEAAIGDSYIEGQFVKPVPEPHVPTQEEINEEARAYLASTDWYVVRFTETGVEVPEEITIKRQEAREAIK